MPRVDLPPKLTGEYLYTPDVRVPGMLHGRVLRPANVVSTKLAAVDESSVKNIPGIVKVVRQGSFVGVVAETETEWATDRSRKRRGSSRVTRAPPTAKLPANRDEIDAST